MERGVEWGCSCLSLAFHSLHNVFLCVTEPARLSTARTHLHLYTHKHRHIVCRYTHKQILNHMVIAGSLPTETQTVSSDTHNRSLSHAHTPSHTQAQPGPQALITKALTGPLRENSKLDINISAVFSCLHCLATMMYFQISRTG